MKRIHLLIIVLVALALAAIFRRRIQDVCSPLVQRLLGRATVADRLEQFGPQSRDRLRPFFEAKSVPYPPEQVVLVGLKTEKMLEIYAPDDSGEFLPVTG